MFRLDADVFVTGKVEDVDLALSSTPQSINTVVNVNGYGLIEGATSTSLLHQVNVSIVDSSMCSNFYTSFNAERNICSFDPIRNAGPCPGDSGSSLVLYTPPESQSSTPRTLASSQASALDRRWISVGIVSGGKNVPCGTPGSPAFYTRVSYYLPWIQSKLTAYW
jgi:secreted trypsin-like serine protease